MTLCSAERILYRWYFLGRYPPYADCEKGQAVEPMERQRKPLEDARLFQSLARLCRAVGVRIQRTGNGVGLDEHHVKGGGLAGPAALQPQARSQGISGRETA